MRKRRRMSRASVARMKRGRRRRRITLAVIGTLLAVAAAAVGWFGVSAWIAKSEMESAVASARDIQSDVTDGDLAAAADRIETFSAHIDKAYAQTSQPVWALAGLAPYYGSDVTAVRRTVHILEDVSNNALPALADVARAVDPDAIGVTDGTVSLGGLESDAVASNLARANRSLTDAVARLDNVGGIHVARVGDAIAQGRKKLDSIADLTDAASRLADTLPVMLGLGDSEGSSSTADGASRTYLLLAQNNAELRATGGIPASWGTLTVTRGRLELGSFSTPVSSTILGQDDAAALLTPDERNLFSTRMASYYQDLNFTPDFPRAAELARDVWKRMGRGSVDGVIGVDPVFLQRMLAVAGPVTLDDGTTLDGTNTARILLNDIYLDTSTQEEQEAFFAMAAGRAFDHVLHDLGGSSSASGKLALLKVIRESATDGHLYVWSSHEAEQDRLDGTGVSGSMPGKPAEPVAGVYFNDATMGKMDWYLKREVTGKADRTYPNGARQYTITVTLTNTADAATVAAAPDLLRGYDENGKARHGEIETVLYVYAPTGGRLVDWSEDFDQIATHDGLTVGAKTVTLKPGERFTTTVHVLASPAAGDTPLQIRTTPDTD